jgi:hypothetical protein
MNEWLKLVDFQKNIQKNIEGLHDELCLECFCNILEPFRRYTLNSWGPYLRLVIIISNFNKNHPLMRHKLY